MKYRVIELNGKETLLEEDEVRSLIRRYDPDSEYEDCILCLKYHRLSKVHLCECCPIGKYKRFACYHLAGMILGTDTKADITTIAHKKHNETKQDALKLKEWFENLPMKED